MLGYVIQRVLAAFVTIWIATIAVTLRALSLTPGNGGAGSESALSICL